MKRIHRKVTLGVLAAVMLGVFASAAGLGTAARQVPPDNTVPPSISGTAQQSQTLTANNGTWTGTAPISYRYQWLRCNSSGNGCSDIGGATERTYLVRAADVNRTVRVRVTATNSDGSSSATSGPTAVVTRSGGGPTGCPSGTGPVNITSLSPPARLTVDGQSLAPSPVGRTTRTLTARFRVSACGGRVVQGALVYVTATPYNQFSIPPEQSTGNDGWAQVSMNRLSGYPATPRQRLLVMFVRARKNGETLLGGVSTRRLVSFRVNLRS
jgi:multidrug efflux pump subunit AcrA (membrane-fusion protein)